MPNESNEATVDYFRRSGYEYAAQYVEMFGIRKLNPWFWHGMNERTEAFYKRCVEEKKPWDYYSDPPRKGSRL